MNGYGSVNRASAPCFIESLDTDHGPFSSTPYNLYPYKASGKLVCSGLIQKSGSA
jgi:hypothetical protein